MAEEIRDVAPKDIGASDLITRVADLGTRLGVTAMVAGLWPATSYGAGLTRAFDRLSPGRNRELKGLRGRALALVALLPLFVGGTLLATFAGSQALGESSIAIVAGMAVALLAGFLTAGAAVAVIYWIFPPEPLGWRGILRATAVTATGVSFLSLAFVLYLSLGANFGKHYVSSGLAGIVLLAVWLFLANALLLLGFKVGSAR
jgi:uncharacterized BrkB/YihY/UPF0761 family membrane protein